MAFNVSTLTNYVQENENSLFTSSLFSAETAALIKAEGNVMVEVKSSATVNVMDTDAAFQDDSGCGFNASGTTTFTQRTLTVGKIKVQEALCPKDLESKYLQKKLPAGSNYTDIIYAQEFAERKAGKIGEQLETAIWQGDTSSANINLNKFDGFVKIIGAASGVVDANTTPFVSATVTSITAANALTVVRAIKNALPARIKGKSDVKIFCGYDVFDLLVDGYVNANYFAFTNSIAEGGEFTVPGTSLKVKAVHGLDGTNKLYAMRMSNLFLGVDMLDEDDKFEMWYSQDNRNVRFHVGFKYGVQVAFPTEIVKFIV